MHAVLLLTAVISVSGFIAPRTAVVTTTKLHESFGLGPYISTVLDAGTFMPKEVLGEEAYVKFVTSFDPDALRGDALRYKPLDRIRALKLLTVTAESGLLEALEAKGLTLSKIEKLLPIIDDLGLLPLLIQNQKIILASAWLLIEPASSLLPVVSSVLRTSPVIFSAPGGALVGAGAFELLTDNGLLGGVLALLGVPLFALGTALGVLESDLPAVTSSSSTIAITSNAPSAPKGNAVFAAKKASPIVVKKSPKEIIASLGERKSNAPVNGQRKTIKIK